jgi:hypothetical protein
MWNNGALPCFAGMERGNLHIHGEPNEEKK